MRYTQKNARSRKFAEELDMIDRIIAELKKRAQAEGNGFKITRKKDNKDMWIWFQENGKFAIYFDDGNVWRDRSKDEKPVVFRTLTEMAEYLMK